MKETDLPNVWEEISAVCTNQGSPSRMGQGGDLCGFQEKVTGLPALREKMARGRDGSCKMEEGDKPERPWPSVMVSCTSSVHTVDVCAPS